MAAQAAVRRTGAEVAPRRIVVVVGVGGLSGILLGVFWGRGGKGAQRTVVHEVFDHTSDIVDGFDCLAESW